MTFMTSWFNNHKKCGKIEKSSKGRFHNGNIECERRIYKDIETGKLYVILNRNVYEFKPYKNQPYDDYMIGHI